MLILFGGPVSFMNLAVRVVGGLSDASAPALDLWGLAASACVVPRPTASISALAKERVSSRG